MLNQGVFLSLINRYALECKSIKPGIEIGICGDVNYTDEQITGLKGIDYLSVSLDKFPYVRVQSARND